MRELVTEESFDITGRGVVVVFRGDAEALPLATRFPVSVERPDGAIRKAEASVEYVLRHHPVRAERCALLIYGLTKLDAPPGSTIRVPSPPAV
jgi:hypothetical protein